MESYVLTPIIYKGYTLRLIIGTLNKYKHVWLECDNGHVYDVVAKTLVIEGRNKDLLATEGMLYTPVPTEEMKTLLVKEVKYSGNYSTFLKDRVYFISYNTANCKITYNKNMIYIKESTC